VEPFATADQLATRLQTTFDAHQYEAAEQAVELVSDTFRERTGQTIYPTEQHTATFRRAVAIPTLWLPHPPAIPLTVNSIEVDDVAVAADLWIVDRDHAIRRTLGTWTGEIEVVYTVGFDEPPGALTQTVLDIVTRGWGNTFGVTQETVGPFSQSFGAPAAQGWRPDELAMLDRYRQAI
jgi:hypothetical protein